MLCVFWLLHQPPILPSLSLCSSFPITWQTVILKLDLLITLQYPYVFKWKKNHMSLTLNKKLGMIKLNKGGLSRANKGQKLGFLGQLAKLWMQRKHSWRKLKMLLQWTYDWKESKTDLLVMVEKVLAIQLGDPTNHNIPWIQNLIQNKVLALFNSLNVERGEKAVEKKSEAGRLWFDIYKERSHFYNMKVQVSSRYWHRSCTKYFRISKITSESDTTKQQTSRVDNAL